MSVRKDYIFLVTFCFCLFLTPDVHSHFESDSRTYGLHSYNAECGEQKRLDNIKKIKQIKQMNELIVPYGQDKRINQKSSRSKVGQQDKMAAVITFMMLVKNKNEN